MEIITVFLPVVLPLFFLVISFIAGSIIESNYKKNIVLREEKFSEIVVTNLKKSSHMENIKKGVLCKGVVVIGTNYIRRFLAGLKTLVGGRIRSYEDLIEMARREAVLRLKEDASKLGSKLILNVKIETSTIAQGGMFEVIAYGTAVVTNT
jgi:uncharacterized protein YbjQ (UPF0145 family)